MDERQAAILKRKREEEGNLSDSPMVNAEQSKADQDVQNTKAKKRKLGDSKSQPSVDVGASVEAQDTEEQRVQRRKEQKAEKKQRKKEKKAKLKDKLERQKARKKEAKQHKKSQEEGELKERNTKKDKSRTDPDAKDKRQASTEDESDEEDVAEVINIDRGTAFTEGAPMKDDDSSSSPSDRETEEVFSPLHDSGVSSSSSIPPTFDQIMQTKVVSSAPGHPTATEEKKSSQKVSLPPKSSSAAEEDPKQRLQAALSAFRAERKADSGPKSRSELLEQRRRQEERRRAEKKEQRRQEKEEEARKQEQEIAKRFSPGGSGSLLGSPRSPIIESENENFSFGRVAFVDGSSLEHANSLTEPPKKKGPSDPATALKAAQAKQKRLSGYDADKRENIHEKDMWMNARKRAAGEKVKDDTSLLKKALKRHEGQKKKSEKEWTERKEGVQKSMHMKQKKRTENLEKRKDEKGQKGKKGKVKRPGFEGSFRGRTGGGKKKA